MRYAVLISIILGISGNAHAIDEGDVRLGVSAGNVNLTGDAGDEFGNALSYGLQFNYATSEELLFDVGVAFSTHEDLKRRAVDLGVNFYTGAYDALLWNLVGGAAFINHSFTLEDKDYTSDAFALYVGGGSDFEVGKQFLAGIQLKYYKAFATTVNVDGDDFNAIQDSIAVYIRAMYTF